MFNTDPYTTERIMHDRVEEKRQEAEIQRLVRELRVNQRSWVSRRLCWLRQQSARLLIAAGQRLDEATLSPKSLVKG